MNKLLLTILLAVVTTMFYAFAHLSKVHVEDTNALHNTTTLGTNTCETDYECEVGHVND